MLQQQQMALEEKSQIEALKKENERLEETTTLTRVSELEAELKREMRLNVCGECSVNS